MRVSSKRSYISSPQSATKSSDAKRRRTKSPARLLSAASLQSPFDDSKDDVDDVPFLSDCDAGVPESIVPSVFGPDDAAACLILSLAEPREELLPSTRGNRSTVAGCCGAVSGPSSSSRREARVRFARNPVNCVQMIPSHRSLTKEQKRLMYRDISTLHAEAHKNYAECEFERSRYCFENALEEECFFRDRRGELIHPAHWAAFVSDIVTSLTVDDSSVPPGFSSLDEYFDHLFAYERFFDNAVQSRVFPPPEP